MDRVARLSARQRRELFAETAARMDLLPGLVEKDFWVCWTLKQLFANPDLSPRLLFKGGTTLSKVFGVIKRFSEDVDLAVDYVHLGYTGKKDPLAAKSKSQLAKLAQEMITTCRGYIGGDFRSSLALQFTSLLGGDEGWSLGVDANEPDVLDFKYPRVSDAVEYLRPGVRLELGTHAEFTPRGRYTIQPYAAEHFPSLFEVPRCEVQAITAERTFWEKATILHQEHHRPAEKGTPRRMSRHYYDVYMLAQRSDIVDGALADRELLTRVVRHKQRFYPCAWARYERAVPATLQLLPSSTGEAFLKRDYQSMRSMFFDKAPSFDDILAGLRVLEGRIRTMA
jgi:hypothetical protein